MGRWYLTSQSNDVDILGARLEYADDSQASRYKHRKKHIEIAHPLVCWERHMVLMQNTKNDAAK